MLAAIVLRAAHLGLRLQLPAHGGPFGQIKQRRSSPNWTQRTPAGLPKGMPGIAELMEGAMQQAAQPLRQEKVMPGC
jgi:hypothetical protein